MFIKKGDLVLDDFLGKGEVMKVITSQDGQSTIYLVLFDVTPPLDYNGESNPCLRFKGSLEKL